jgi:hypothetical protein
MPANKKRKSAGSANIATKVKKVSVGKRIVAPRSSNQDTLDDSDVEPDESEGLTGAKGRSAKEYLPSPVPSPPSSPNKERVPLANISNSELEKLQSEMSWLKEAYMKSRESQTSDQELPPGFVKGNYLNSLPDCVLICTWFTADLRSFAVIAPKVQRGLAIAVIRDEMKMDNLKLEEGGIRKNQVAYDWVLNTFSIKLRKLGYSEFSGLLGPVVKQALVSVLKTEGRKKGEKQGAYNLM